MCISLVLGNLFIYYKIAMQIIFCNKYYTEYLTVADNNYHILGSVLAEGTSFSSNHYAVTVICYYSRASCPLFSNFLCSEPMPPPSHINDVLKILITSVLAVNL